jgi:hypothetical protein
VSDADGNCRINLVMNHYQASLESPTSYGQITCSYEKSYSVLHGRYAPSVRSKKKSSTIPTALETQDETDRTCHLYLMWFK